MSDYEKKMLSSLTLMKTLCAVGVIVNVLVQFNAESLLKLDITVGNVLICLIWVYGLINGLGYLNQNVPIFVLGISRMIQIVYYQVRYAKVNKLAVIILVVLDIIWVLFLLSHKTKYEYEKE